MRSIPSEDITIFYKELIASMQNQQTGNSVVIDRVFRNLQRARNSELTPRQAEVLQLRFEGGMSIREIARELNVAPSTVSRTIARAEERLRRCLQYAF